MGKTTSDRKQAGGYAAPISINTEANARRVDEARQVGIFEIDGKAYTMPAIVRAEIGLTYLDLSNSDGDDAAALYLLTETLGREAYDALKAVKGLTDDQFEGILTRVRDIALPKGSNPTPNKSRG